MTQLMQEGIPLVQQLTSHLLHTPKGTATCAPATEGPQHQRANADFFISITSGAVLTQGRKVLLMCQVGCLLSELRAQH